MEEFTGENLGSMGSIGSGVRIKAIGVGGGGGNMINFLVNTGIHGVDLMVANTDAQALEASSSPYKIQLGVQATKGLGAGMKPEVGAASADESFESIKTMLSGADLVFISTGLGGGTGTGASPVIARAAKELGALTVSIATTPFRFEGKKRRRLAEKGLQELRAESDSIILVSNENLLNLADKNLGMRDSFKLVDSVLSSAISGISSLITSHNESDINLDFADVKTVMSHKGLALMGVGVGSGSDSATEAAKSALSSPILNDIDISGAMGIIVHFKINPNYPLSNISTAMDLIEGNGDEDADVIFGTSADESLAIDEVQITLIATGFESEEDIEKARENQEKEALGKQEAHQEVNKTFSEQIAIDEFQKEEPTHKTLFGGRANPIINGQTNNFSQKEQSGRQHNPSYLKNKY